MTTLEQKQALELLEWLITDSGCTGGHSRNDLCKLLKMACTMNYCDLPLGVLVLQVAERVIRKEALEAARKGKRQIDVVTIDYTAQAAQLRQIADSYKAEIEAAKTCLIDPVAVVSMANSCATTVDQLFASCGCQKVVQGKEKTFQKVPTCNWECCDPC